MGITTDSEISDGKDREYPFTNQYPFFVTNIFFLFFAELRKVSD